MTVAGKGGRPVKFKSVKELEKKIQTYFDSCFEMQWKERAKRDPDTGMKIMHGKTPEIEYYQVEVMLKVPTVSGLAVALDTSRRTLINYEENEEFFHTIKRAKQFIESITEEGMLNGTLNSTGSIFNLKNNYGWVDKTEVDQKVTGDLQVKVPE